MADKWEILVQQASDLISKRENYQRLMGRLAKEISDSYGAERLGDLAEDVKEAHGLSVAASTLRNYLWVYERTSSLNLPEDLSYRTLQYIASSGRPEYWAKKIEKEGLSSAEVYRLIRIEKGLDKNKKEILCPICGGQFEV